MCRCIIACFKSELPLSALLKSVATDCGMPTFFANAGLCAAAAIIRACDFDLLGMIVRLHYKVEAQLFDHDSDRVVRWLPTRICSANRTPQQPVRAVEHDLTRIQRCQCSNWRTSVGTIDLRQLNINHWCVVWSVARQIRYSCHDYSFTMSMVGTSLPASFSMNSIVRAPSIRTRCSMTSTGR